MKPVGAIQAPVSCDISMVALEDAVSAICPKVVCTLNVHEQNFFDVKQVLKEIGAMVSPFNPLSPQINLVIDPLLTDYDEWYLECDGKKYWSSGA